MKAPDKIYLAESDNIKGEVISNFASSTPFRIHDSIAYIRKDALLQWAKEQASITEKLNGRGAMLKAWDSLIDKIESL